MNYTTAGEVLGSLKKEWWKSDLMKLGENEKPYLKACKWGESLRVMGKI